MAFKMKGFSGFKQVKEGTKVRAQKDPKPLKDTSVYNNPARTFGTKFQEEKPIKLNPRGTNIKLPKSTVDKPMNYGMRKKFSKAPLAPKSKFRDIATKFGVYLIS